MDGTKINRDGQDVPIVNVIILVTITLIIVLILHLIRFSNLTATEWLMFLGILVNAGFLFFIIRTYWLQLQQRDINAFFQLLNYYYQMVNEMQIKHEPIEFPNGTATHGVVPTEPSIHKGRDCFNYFYDEYKRRYEWCSKNRIGESELEFINLSYRDYFLKNYELYIGNYFRNLYNIVKFVKQSDISDKKKYTNILRAQLSSDELLLLFYNCLSDRGYTKFKPLIEKYALLKTMPRDNLCNQEHIKEYHPSAFNYFKD